MGCLSALLFNYLRAAFQYFNQAAAPPSSANETSPDTVSVSKRDTLGEQSTVCPHSLEAPRYVSAHAASARDAGVEPEPVPAFSYKQVDRWPRNKPFPPIFKVSKADPDSSPAKAFEKLSLKLGTPKAADDELYMAAIVDEPFAALGGAGLDDADMEPDYFDRFIPKPLRGIPNTMNLWNTGARREFDGMRCGANFHIDGANYRGEPESTEGATVILQVVSDRNYFLYPPQRFTAAAKFAHENGITLPASPHLERRFPGISAFETADFTKMGAWYATGYPTMREHDVGPYAIALKPGELCVFKNGTVHGTLDNGEPYAVVVNFFNVNVSMG